MLNTRDTLKLIGGVIIIIILIDVVALGLWIASGQVPLSESYLGATTANIIRAVFF